MSAFALVASRYKHERAFLGTEEVADALGVGLDGHGQLLAVTILRDRDDVKARAFVPDGVAHLERTIGIAELSRSIGEADDQRRHNDADYRLALCALGRRKLAGDDRPAPILIDPTHYPELASVGDEVSDLGKPDDVLNLPVAREVEHDASLGVTHGGQMPDDSGPKRWRVRRDLDRTSGAVGLRRKPTRAWAPARLREPS